MLTYNDLQNISIQVTVFDDNFKMKLDEIYFSYVFVNGKVMKHTEIGKGLKLISCHKLTLQHIVQQQPVEYLQSI